MMLFDLHVSTVMSGNSLVAPEDLIDYALDLGLAGIGVTERNSYAASEVCVEFAEGLPLLILRGLEINTDLGEMLIFGLTELDAQVFERPGKWIAMEAVEYVRFHGGICIPAHPFDPDRPSIGEKLTTLPGVFAIEGLNGRTPDLNNQEACRFADTMRLKVIGGSDALNLGQIGRCVTEFEQPIRDEIEFLEELRAGRYTARYFIQHPSL